MKQLFVSISLMLISCSVFADGRLYKPTDKITFTYEEYRKLSHAHQEEWIKELRNFNRNVDLIIEGERLTAKKPKFWSFFELINLKPVNAGLCVLANEVVASTEARAEAPAQAKICRLKKETKQQQALVCVSCTSDGFELLYSCAPNDRTNPNNAEIAAKQLLAKVNDPTSKQPHLAISQEELATQVKTINTKGYATFDYSYMKPASLTGAPVVEKSQGVETTKSAGMIPAAASTSDAKTPLKGERVTSELKKGRIPRDTSHDTGDLSSFADRKAETAPSQKTANAEVVQDKDFRKPSRFDQASPKTETQTSRSESSATKQEQPKTVTGSKPEKCQVRKSVSGGAQNICMVCPGDNVSGVNVCAPASQSSKTIAKKLMQGFESKNYEGSKVDINEKSLTEVIAVTKGETEEVSSETKEKLALGDSLSEGAVEFTAPVIRREALVKTVVLPTTSERVAIELPKDANIKGVNKGKGEFIEASASGPIMSLEKRDGKGKVVDRTSNDDRKPEFHKKELDDLGGTKANDNLDVEEVTKTERLACIYAGWAVKTEGSCQPITEKTLVDANGKRVTYSCKAGGTTSDTVIYGDNPDGKSIVLCNPVVFGLINGKPICIKKDKKATEICTSMAPKAEDALAIAKNNPEEYRALVRRVDVLCQSDESKLREHFVKRKRTEKQIENALKDLGTTCSHLRERMAQLKAANDNTAPDAGTR